MKAEPQLTLDADGHLANLADWSPAAASALAAAAGIELTEAHWEIVTLVRQFHQQHGLSPVMRVLVKLAQRELGSTKGNSHYLLGLFPDSPARVVARIAGLPRPTNCL